MKPIEHDIFNDFLILHDAFDYFYNNIDPLLKKYKFKVEKSTIEDLFTWGSSPQGVEYWRSLSILWEKEFESFLTKESTR